MEAGRTVPAMIRTLGCLAILGACSTSPTALTQQPTDELAFGSVFAQVTDSVTDDGAPGFIFGASLTPLAAPVSICSGASMVVGACCFVPAPTASAGPVPDLGPFELAKDSTMLGSIALSFNPGGPPTGSPEAYGADLLNPDHWNSGDDLEISGEFDPVSVPGLGLPDVNDPSAIARASSLVFAWTPDPNAHAMTVALTATEGTVGCIVPDSTGTVAIDTSLLQQFAAGEMCWGTSTREVDRYVELDGGYVTIASQGVDEFIVPVE
jgi:hypothetical protein